MNKIYVFRVFFDFRKCETCKALNEWYGLQINSPRNTCEHTSHILCYDYSACVSLAKITNSSGPGGGRFDVLGVNREEREKGMGRSKYNKFFSTIQTVFFEEF